MTQRQSDQADSPRCSRRSAVAGLAASSALMLAGGQASGQQPSGRSRFALAPPAATRPAASQGLTRLTKTADIGGVRFANCGRAFTLAKSVDGLRLHDIELDRSGFLLNCPAAGIDCTNARIQRIRSLNARMFPELGTGVVSIRGDLSGLVVEDIEFVGDGVPYRGEGKVYGIVQLKGKLAGDRANGFSVRRVRGGGLWIEGAAYPNTDGISTEAGHTNGRIEDCDLWDFSDAGIDLKGDGNRLDRVRVRNARQSVKLWGNGSHGRIESIDPRFAHVLIAGGEAPKRMSIGYLAAHGDPRKPLVRFERGVSHVKLSAVSIATDQKLISAAGEARGSTLTMPDGRVLTA
jgi:hypothetical protein